MSTGISHVSIGVTDVEAARDAWFLGFSSDYVTGVWMGYDDNTPLSGVTGSGLPAEIFAETMKRVHEGLPVQPLPLIEPAQGRQLAQQGSGATERTNRNNGGYRPPPSISGQTGSGFERGLIGVLNDIFGN